MDELIDSAGWEEQRPGDRSSRGRGAADRRSGYRDRGRGDTGYSRPYPASASQRYRDDESEWERDWDAGWETGTWDTGWATGWNNGVPDNQGGWDDDWHGGDGYEDDAWSRSLVALGAASMAEVPLGRIARLRLVLRERPAAGAMLIVFLVGFLLTCLAPLLPLMRLGYDVADAARRATSLQALVKSAGTQLIQPAKLAEVQGDVDGIEHDLYEINAVTNVLGAPLAAMSPTLKDYRLLIRMGYDLTAAADEGIRVGQTLLTPLQGGALSANDNSPGITPADIDQARGVLADAQVRVGDAIAAYQALDQKALPSQLRPGSKYGSYLALLPEATTAFSELNTLLTIAPGLLGVGQPAYYLVVAMDRSELRPGGGFQGNYGILTLAGGKQPKSQPLSLNDTYNLDRKYYSNTLQSQGANVGYANQQCGAKQQDQLTSQYFGPEPPNYYWWWPTRDFSWCFNWGLRDANLSPDFPSNARTAMSIVQQANVLPGPGQLQGVVAFTPAFIADLLNVPEIGSITLSQYPGDPPVTAANLEQQIHCHQLPFGVCPGSKSGGTVGTGDRKAFTHFLSQAMLAKIKTLHGSGLKPVIQVALDAMKSKDLQVYFSDPRAELILQELGLASQINAGGGDGFFVVDTNDGGNKANLYVSEQQQDLVTLLPNGGAIHRLEITVTYAYPKGGWVYADSKTPEDYNDVERVYMPGSATLLGYGGFALPQGASPYLPRPLNDGGDGPDHFMYKPVTNSDVPGRTMVMGFVNVSCHDDLYTGQPMYGRLYQQSGQGDGQSCNLNPNTNHQVIDVEWYTPNAWTPSGNGHGVYTEMVEKQAGTDGPPTKTNPSGSVVTVQVYVDTGLLHQSNVQGIDWTDATLRAEGLKHAKQVFNGPLASDATVSYGW